jgi:hypothetical protein
MLKFNAARRCSSNPVNKGAPVQSTGYHLAVYQPQFDIRLLGISPRLIGSYSAGHYLNELIHTPYLTFCYLESNKHLFQSCAMSMPPPQGGAPKPNKPRSPMLRPLGPNSLMTEITPSNPPPAASDQDHGPVEPAVLADAINKLDTLRQKTPAGTAATSPVASGASSPNPMGLPSAERIVAAVQDARSGPGPVTGTPGGPTSVPGTPHFGAQTGL